MVYIPYIYQPTNRQIVVGIVNRLLIRGLGNRSSIADGGKRVSSLQNINVQGLSGTLFPEVKQPWIEADHSSLSRVGIKNERR